MKAWTKWAMAVVMCLFAVAPAIGQSQPKVPKDITDITIRTGAQVKPRASDLLDKDENVRAAGKLFQDRGLTVNLEGLMEIRFRKISTNERFQLVYIPYAEDQPQKGLLRLTVWASGPKGTHVWAVTARIEGQEPTIEEDYAINSGKAEPGKGRLKDWFKCLLAGCGSALAGCAYGDGVYAQCAFLWCGGAALSCALLALF